MIPSNFDINNTDFVFLTTIIKSYPDLRFMILCEYEILGYSLEIFFLRQSYPKLDTMNLLKR